jgi:hypothetical protein
MRMEQGIDVGSPRRLKLPAALGRLILLLRDGSVLRTKHFFRPNRFRQISAALIALCSTQAKKCLQAKSEVGHAGLLARGGFERGGRRGC